MTLDEELDSKEFLSMVNNLQHIPQMKPQTDNCNTLEDTGRFPDNKIKREVVK